MRDYIAVDVAYTAKQIDAMLAAFPELADDDELRADTFEGETDLAALLSRLVRMRQERAALADGLSSYIDVLSERKARLLRGADGIKSLMLKLMSTAKLHSLVLPEATVSIMAGRKRVVIDDVKELPQGFVRMEPTPLKIEIAAALNVGEQVPGAHMELGDDTLVIRTK